MTSDNIPPENSSSVYFSSYFVPPSVEDLQAKIPNLKILSFIGHGGMGTYYKAHHTRLDRLTAVKILPVDPRADAGLIAGFKKEAKAMARLNHSNIISIFDFIEKEDALYLLVEYVEGDIFERLIHARNFQLSEILAIITQVCSAISYAHQSGVIHRDLRPGNTLLDQSGVVKIGDFGLARLIGEELFRRQLTETNQAMGTIDYVAPEQLIEGADVDHRADIYSIGMMMYKLVTKQLPRGKFVVPSQLVPGLDPRVDDLVIRCLQRDPANRYQSAKELWKEVSRLLENPQATRQHSPKFRF